MEKIDFIAIGDTVTDAFIRIRDASVNCDLQKHNCKLCLDFGSKVPYESVEVIAGVGNSANAAVAAARLGLSSGLISDLGADEHGKECLAALSGNKVRTDFVREHAGIPTNYHYVLWYEEERTILVKHEEYPYALPKNISDAAPKWLYLSSMGENSLPYHQEIAAYLTANPETKLAFQPGTFQMKLGTKAMAAFYSRSEVFICNVEEAQLILNLPEGKVSELMAGLHALGVKIAVVTDGPRGAYASDGTKTWFMPPYPDPKPPYERTGAGDAFASTFVAFLALGMSVEEALKRAPINSMSVVQEVGAQKGLLSREKLEEWLAKAPADYFPKEI